MTCECGKVCYSYLGAHEALRDAKRYNHLNHKKKIPKRAYFCDVCGMYHLTSMPDRTKKTLQ
jgi:hypothetical protein